MCPIRPPIANRMNTTLYKCWFFLFIAVRRISIAVYSTRCIHDDLRYIDVLLPPSEGWYVILEMLDNSTINKSIKRIESRLKFAIIAVSIISVNKERTL